MKVRTFINNHTVKILFVCHGNICRSPMAEFILKKMVLDHGLADKFIIESAAVSTEEIGNSIYPPAKRCLNAHSIHFDRNKTARQITRMDYDRFDLIICMDRMNLRWIKHIISDDPEDKIHLMMSFAGSDVDVADPWYTGDFEATYTDISNACEHLINHFVK